MKPCNLIYKHSAWKFTAAVNYSAEVVYEVGHRLSENHTAGTPHWLLFLYLPAHYAILAIFSSDHDELYFTRVVKLPVPAPRLRLSLLTRPSGTFSGMFA